MAVWQVVETSGDDPGALTDEELIAVSILLALHGGEPHSESNVYWRAWNKIQPQVEVALGRKYG